MYELNPLKHPICFMIPNRITPFSAWREHIPFAMFLVDLLRPKLIVELGTQYGVSYCAFCQAVKELNLDTRCYAIDTWEGDTQAGFYGTDVLSDLRAYHENLYGGFSRLIQSTFDEALPHFTDGTIDILHIDGYHTYESVKHDFESWFSKISLQGVALFHDINVLEGDYGVRRFWDEIIQEYPHFEFLHGHGLGLLAKGTSKPKELQSLFRATEKEVATIRSFFFQLGRRLDLHIELSQQRIQFQDEVNRLQSELSQQRIQFQDYVRAINSSWSWCITSPLRFMVMLWREFTIRRIMLALKHLFRGEIGVVLEGIRAIWKGSSGKLREKLPSDIALNYAMTFFRHDLGDIPPLDQEVDIVIPIYNGMPYLTKLFDSLLCNTDSPYRLILVDDASTDSNIQPFLQNIVQQIPNSVLIRNTENKGFVQSVNTAMQHVRNHFVLLNTDVEVPKNWLQRLMRPVVENANIASVTPFTNAGTVCSFPYMNMDNDLFDNLTVDEIDAFFKLVNPETVSIELPSGVGFCMGMNFDVWKQIGSFNQSVFGHGYGEENDWSMRAHKAGYHNVMVPNLFVYHKSAKSYGQETKERQQRQNLPKVLKLHPSYLQKVDDFIKRDSAKPIRQFLTLLLSTHQAAAGTTLLIDHQWGGGAYTYRQELIRERLGKGEAILLFTYYVDHRLFELRCLYKEYDVAFMVSSFSEILQLLEWISCKEIFYNNLVSFPQPLDILCRIYELKGNSSINLTITLHDYFPICPSYNLINSRGVYCDLPNLKVCRTCLAENNYAYSATDFDIERWRKTWGDVLKVSDTVLLFSESSRTLLTRTYPLRPEQIIVKPHELPVQFTRKPKIDLNEPMNIGIFGSIAYQKGSEIVVEMARILEDKAPEVKITIVGTLNNVPRLKNLKVIGPYKPSELPDLIEKYKINISLFPSIWPETFSYICSELMELGMPLCCFDLGAQGERVSKYRLGHIIPTISAQVAAEEIIQFFTSLKTNNN